MSVNRTDLWIVWGLIAYFAAHTLIRVATPVALTIDDAELLALPQGFRWGYGPQLPLFNWLAHASFLVFGVSEFSITLPKQILLCAMHLFIYFALRPTLGAFPSLIVAVGMFWVPNVLWEFQRASTHTIAMMAAGAMTLGAWMRLQAHPSWSTVLWLGLAIGLGGLSKYNYWIIPAALFAADLMGRVGHRRHWLGAFAIGLSLCAPVYLWIASNPDLAFGSVRKLAVTEDIGFWAQRLRALGLFGRELAALFVMALLGAWLLRGRNWSVHPHLMPLAIAAGLAMAAVTLFVIAAGPGQMTARWLSPLVILAVPVMLGMPHMKLGKRTTAFLGLTGLLLISCLAASYSERSKPNARQIAVFADFATKLEAEFSPDVVVSDYMIAGNLAFAEAPFNVSSQPVAGEAVLYIDRTPPADALVMATGNMTLRLRENEVRELTLTLVRSPDTMDQR